MFGYIVGALLISWFLNLFGFYTNIYYGFLQPLVNFEVTTAFYYGSFVALGLFAWIISLFTRKN